MSDDIPADETAADDTAAPETAPDIAAAADAASPAAAPADATNDEAPADEPTVDDAPVDDAPVDDAPDDETPVDETPADEPSVDDAPADETPVDETPVDEALSDEPTAGDAPVDDASDGDVADDVAEADPEEADTADDEAEGDQTGSATGFAALGLRNDVLDSLTKLGYEEPTPIQREAIPHLLDGSDLIGQAATGTGKTAAFALPVLDAINPDAGKRPQALIIVPTRELAVQVSEAMFKYGQGRGLRVLPIFGGQPIGRQLNRLDRGTHVVVATPGRAIDHIKRGSLKLDEIRTVVLDEADEMLDMGFSEDIEAILESTPDKRQTVLFSATMPPRIAALARKFQNDPVKVQIGRGTSDDTTGSLIRQRVYMVQRRHKASALGRILDIESPGSTIIFCRTRVEVDELTVTMNARGYRAEALHGGMDQSQRDRVMGRLRSGSAELLIATDVAARGLDVETLTHVVNYDVPAAAESYVHRIGRVGRAGREGTAITIAEPKQRRLLQNIERLTKQKLDIVKVPTVADLRARQIQLTTDAIREGLADGDLDDYQPIIDALLAADDADADDEGATEIAPRLTDREIALAAIKLVHAARGATVDEVEIPDASDFNKRDKKPFDKRQKGRDKGQKSGKGARTGRLSSASDETGFLFINIGRKLGLRPADIVGAVANESGLPGRQIGPIRIAENYSVVGVPEDLVNDVVSSMKSTKIRGKQANVRRYKE